MLPIRNLALALGLSTGLLAGGGWLASAVTPDEAASVSAESERPARPEPHGGLEVVAQGVRNSDGDIIFMVFDDAEALRLYDYEQAVGYAEIPASSGAVQAGFPDLNEGPYAVTLFHDENGDRDFNMAGDLPLEGYGTSGAKGPYDEPSFAQAAVDPGHVAIEVHYMN